MANTKAAGAVIERAYLYKWIARQIKETGCDKGPNPGCLQCLSDLRDWLKAQPKRTTRKGGIGRK